MAFFRELTFVYDIKILSLENSCGVTSTVL